MWAHLRPHSIFFQLVVSPPPLSWHLLLHRFQLPLYTQLSPLGASPSAHPANPDHPATSPPGTLAHADRAANVCELLAHWGQWGTLPDTGSNKSQQRQEGQGRGGSGPSGPTKAQRERSRTSGCACDSERGRGAQHTSGSTIG